MLQTLQVHQLIDQLETVGPKQYHRVAQRLDGTRKVLVTTIFEKSNTERIYIPLVPVEAAGICPHPQNETMLKTVQCETSEE